MSREILKHYLPIACAVSAMALLLSPCSNAADWKISPSLNLTETYTDNTQLSSQAAQTSNFVTQISPGISVAGIGPRLKVNANYALQHLIYSQDSRNDATHNQLHAGANAELVNNLFFLDSTAVISQQNISLFGPQTTDNINVTGNRAEVRTYSISPFLRHRFDSTATSELRYTRDAVSTNTSGLSNSKADSLLFQLNSGSAFNRLGWGLKYNKKNIDYSSTPSVDQETTAADLRVLITPKFSLTATRGYDKYSYLANVDKPNGHSWSTGFAWAPFARTSLAASSGRKFFGKTYMLAANHRSRRTMWNLNYNQDITSMHSQQFIGTDETSVSLNQLWTDKYPDPLLRQQNVDTFIHDNGLKAFEPINSFTNQFILQKRLQASVAFNGAKSTLLFSMFHVLREAQTSQMLDNALLTALNATSNLALNDKTKQDGINALWSWAISPRSSASFSAAYTKTVSLSSDITNYNKMTKLRLTSQLHPRLNGSVEIRHSQLDSNQSGSDYRENAITASLSMKF